MTARPLPERLHRGLRSWRLIAAGVLACAPVAPVDAADVALTVPRFSEESLGPAPAPWVFAGLPRQTKPQTQFAIVDDQGIHVLSIHTDRGYGNLALVMKRDLTTTATLSWRWKLDLPNLKADLRTKDGDDAPLKVCVGIDYDTDGLSLTDRAELRLIRVEYTTPVPTATICYVWDHALAPGTTLVNAFTDRIRYIVLEGGEVHLHSWVSEKRNVSEDFWKTFGSEFRAKAPDQLPELSGVLVGADADNTGVVSQGSVGDIELSN